MEQLTFDLSTNDSTPAVPTKRVRFRRKRELPPPTETKRCASCRRRLPLPSFTPRVKGGQGVAANCKECVELRYQSGTFRCNRCSRTLPGPSFVRGAGGRAIQAPCKECKSAAREASALLRALKPEEPQRQRQKHKLSEIDEQGRTATCSSCGPVRIHSDKSRDRDAGFRCGQRARKLTKYRYLTEEQLAEAPAPRRYHRITNVRGEEMRATCLQCGDTPVKWSESSSVFVCVSPAHLRQRADARREGRRLAQFGLTADDYNRMNEQQGRVCAICGQNRTRSDSDGSLVVDHDHATGAVRALLCGLCNTGLGQFADDPELLIAAAAYLELHKNSVAA